jgi:hypothetical protein
MVLESFSPLHSKGSSSKFIDSKSAKLCNVAVDIERLDGVAQYPENVNVSVAASGTLSCNGDFVLVAY